MNSRKQVSSGNSGTSRLSEVGNLVYFLPPDDGGGVVEVLEVLVVYLVIRAGGLNTAMVVWDVLCRCH